MFGNKRQSALPTIRLPKLTAMFGFDDLHFLLAQAQQNRGRTVEMPWSNLERTTTFLLSCRCDHGGSEPCWQLFAGEGTSSKLVWTYVSGDATLIFNLVMSECSSGGLHDSGQSSSYARAPAPSLSQDLPQPNRISQPTNPVAPTSQTNTGTFAAITRASKAILEGDLKNMQMPNLLQSVAISKMTGRLTVQGASGVAEVFFEEGAPKHAAAREVTGDLALIELLTWEEGEFHFYPEERSPQSTIKKRLDAVLMEGVTLLDQHKYITNAGVTQDSYLLRKQANLSEADFERMVSKGAPIDLVAQKRFYQSIDNKSTLFEILRKSPMGKTDWVPIMFNMLSCDLVQVIDQLPIEKKIAPLEAMGMDKAAIQGVIKSLCRPETGLITYPALLYFTEQEYFRFESYGYPFAIIIFELRVRRGDPDVPAEPLPLVAAREMARRIGAIKRTLDILGHFETFDYAMLLPNTNTQGAALCANRLVELILTTPLMNDLDSRSLCLSIGVASIPEDSTELGMALAAAVEAKRRAKESTTPVMLFRNLTNLG